MNEANLPQQATPSPTNSSQSHNSEISSNESTSVSAASEKGQHLTVQKTSIIDLYGVQLEVTNRLLETEKKRLKVVEKELQEQLTHRKHFDFGRLDVEQLRCNLRRIQEQCTQLEKEYREAATVVVKTSNKLTKTSRSQPAIGLKATAKLRPSIFGTVTDSEEKSVKSRKLILPPQRPVSSAGDMPAMAALANGYHKVEEVDESETLVYEDSHLVSGSVNALIQHLVPTKTYYPDRTYVFAFLLSSRLFIKPHQLLQRVCQTCIRQQGLSLQYTSKESLGEFGSHMIRFLGEWTDNFPYDFRDERMMEALKNMTQMLVTLNGDLRKDVGVLMHNLFSKLASLQKYEDLLRRINAEVTHKLLNIQPNQMDIYENCSSPLVLAQQLTHIELERLSMIGPEEFVQAFAKANEIQTAYKDLKTTNNLESYVQWFNRLSYFVATEICMHLKKKTRARMVEYFIDVAKECINIGNFNSLMAIIAGLNLSSVQRLKKTWCKVNKEKFEILEHQMDPKNNFGSYRSSLKACLWRFQGAVEEKAKIVIPFFSLFVKDMYFLNEGCANRTDNGHVNFKKCWHLAKQISEFLSWKQIECPFDRHPTVLNYLLTNPVFSENSLQLASFECEPPENNFEKERYKALKEQAGIS